MGVSVKKTLPKCPNSRLEFGRALPWAFWDLTLDRLVKSAFPNDIESAVAENKILKFGTPINHLK